MGDDTDLEAEVRTLRSEVDALHRRIATLEERVERDGSQTGEVPGTDADSPVDASVADAERATADAAPVSATDAADDRGERDDGAESGERERDLERDIGIKWLGLVGGVALIVGVVFFVRLAAESGLLGPFGRVTVGTLGGLALFAGGRLAAERQGYVRWGRIAAGTGLTVAYFSCYAAYGFETYREAIGTPLWAVLLALTVLVAGTAALSVRDGTPVVTGQAFLLGYVTAFIASESAHFVVTPLYALLLSSGLVAIATIRPWSRLVVASVIPTYGVVGLWIGDVDPARSVAAAVVVAAFAIYLVGGYVLRGSEVDGRWFPLQVRVLTVLDALIAATFLEAIAREWFPDAPVEGLAVAGVALALVGVYAVTDRRPVRRDDTAGTLAVALFGGAIVLATGTFASTVGLLAVVCGGIGVAAAADADAFRTGAHLVAAGTVYKLLVVDATELSGFDAAAPLSALTGRPAAFALAIVVCYGLASWFRGRTTRVPILDLEDVPVAAPYAVAGTGLTVALLGLELSALGVSVAWAVFGLVLVGAGLAAELSGLRWQGIAVLGLATAKVFLVDLQDLDTVARTLSFLVLGAILLVASYAYARWRGEDPLAEFGFAGRGE